MKIVDISVSIFLLCAAVLCLFISSYLFNEVILCYKPVVDVNLQSAYDDGYEDGMVSGHSIATDLSDNPFE